MFFYVATDTTINRVMKTKKREVVCLGSRVLIIGRFGREITQ